MIMRWIAVGAYAVAASAVPAVLGAQSKSAVASAKVAAATNDTRPNVESGSGAREEIVLQREMFTYTTDGRRDPFMSLLKTGDLRPMISDLRLATVVYDPVGRSVAVMRDVSTNEQYRVKVGQTLGRMRVTQIRPKAVVFTLEEFGFSRQEVLALNDTTRARSQ